MRSNRPGERQPVDGYSYGYGYRQRDGYGQPATDSELLRQFGRAYDEHVRNTGKLVIPEGVREPSAPALLWALLGLVVLALLVAATIVVGSSLMGPR